MTRLDGKLGDYVGIGMMAMMLGRSPEQTGIVYDMIGSGDIEIHKIGGVSLLKFADMARGAFADAPHASSPPWPAELAGLPMEHLYSRSELAELLDVSVGSVHRFAKIGTVQAIDLSTWNMHSLYYYNPDGSTPVLPIVFNAWGYNVRLLNIGDNELKIDIETDKFYNLESACFGPEPGKVWFLDGDEPVITVEIHERGADV